jgi:hypothetical protein
VGFLRGDDNHDDREIGNALLSLRKRLIREITTEQTASMPKMVMKITSTYQCLMRRTIEAVDGMRAAWNVGNLLTSITMARSLIETGAIVRHLTDSIKKAAEDRDVTALDKAVMYAGFATRDKGLLGKYEEFKEFKAASVSTMIDRMDKSLFHENTPRFREAYAFLSEFVHPNHLGILGLYSNTFPREYRIEFGNVAEKRKQILPHMRVTLSMVWLVEIAAKDIGKLLSTIVEFVPK